MSPISFTDLTLVAPVLIVSAGALFILLADVFVQPRAWPRAFASVMVLLCAVLAMNIYFPPYQGGGTVFAGFVYADVYSWFVSLLILLGTILAILVGMSAIEAEGIESPGEYYSLLLMTTVGALVFATAAELMTLFIGLETMSMGLYCLCGSALKLRRSTESALKYFLLGSFSSAFMLYGIALLYGLTGSTNLDAISIALANADTLMSHCALALLLVGFVFKLGAVPFHFWAPDVYQGAPTPVTAYMACVVKIAAAAATLRVLWSGFGGQMLFWSGAIWYLAVFTMVIGNLVALRQRSVKRMLAYSSVAHAGYMLVGLLSRGPHYEGGTAILYYLVVYSLMTLGAFAVVQAVSARRSESAHPDDLMYFDGLASRNPFLAFSMAIFMLGLAGIPPGMAGLLGKFYLFSAAVKANYVGLAVIGVLCSAVSSFYYLRIIVGMYFRPSSVEGDDMLLPQTLVFGSAVALCVLGAIFLGLFPSALYEGAASAMQNF